MQKENMEDCGHYIQKSYTCTIQCDTMEWTRKELVEGSRLMMQVPVQVQGGDALRFDELLFLPLTKSRFGTSGLLILQRLCHIKHFYPTSHSNLPILICTTCCAASYFLIDARFMLGLIRCNGRETTATPVLQTTR